MVDVLAAVVPVLSAPALEFLPCLGLAALGLAATRPPRDAVHPDEPAGGAPGRPDENPFAAPAEP